MTTFRKTKTTILGILCAAVLMGLTGCGKNANETSVSALNTVIKISAYGSNARKGISDASDIINALNTQLDTSNESSSISRVNAAEGKEIVVPGQFIDMYNAAKTAYTMTDGEFDITVYPFVEVWGFNSGNYHNPSKEELEALRETVNFNGIMTNYYSDSGSYTMILPKKTKITFDGVSRGCATDCAIKQLKADGVDNAIISMPGTVQTMGSKPDGSPWTIAVGDPDDVPSTTPSPMRTALPIPISSRLPPVNRRRPTSRKYASSAMTHSSPTVCPPDCMQWGEIPRSAAGVPTGTLK